MDRVAPTATGWRDPYRAGFAPAPAGHQSLGIDDLPPSIGGYPLRREVGQGAPGSQDSGTHLARSWHSRRPDRFSPPCRVHRPNRPAGVADVQEDVHRLRAPPSSSRNSARAARSRLPRLVNAWHSQALAVRISMRSTGARIPVRQAGGSAPLQGVRAAPRRSRTR